MNIKPAAPLCVLVMLVCSCSTTETVARNDAKTDQGADTYLAESAHAKMELRKLESRSDSFRKSRTKSSGD